MLRRPITLALIIAVSWLGYSYFSDSDNTPGSTPKKESNRPGPEGSDKPEASANNRNKPPVYIASISEVEEMEGLVYRVRPTKAGRLADWEGMQQAWRQAVRQGVPDRAHLRQQFLCHPLSIVGRGKPTWDLEVWRPEVGLERTMLAACNPGE